jgi:hypothetical protein
MYLYFSLFASLHAIFFWWSRIIIDCGAYSFRFSDHGGCSKAVYCYHQTLGFFLPWIWFPRCKVSEMQELLFWIHKYDTLIMWKITGLEERLCRILQDCGGELWRTLAEPCVAMCGWIHGHSCLDMSLIWRLEYEDSHILTWSLEWRILIP